MTFFYDLNKKIAALAGTQLNEGKGAKPDFLDVDKDGDKKEPFKKAVKDKELDEASYSAKSARAGKDIGKPGKAFSKIAKDAAERYGSKEKGEKVAGAVLKKLRAKEDVNEADMEEGNEFSGALAKAKATGASEFEVDGKKYKVTNEGFEEMDAWLAKRKKEQGTGKFDKKKISTGTVYTRRHEEDDEEDNDASDEPKKKGRKTVGAGKGKKIGAKHKGTSKLHRKAAIAEEGVEENYCPHCGAKKVEEKAVSQQQQKFMGMAHAIQKGEKIKGASPELKKVAKTMKKSDVKDFAATKHAGLPKKVKAKEEEVEETTDAPKSKKGGIQFGKGIYESFNSQVENMIAEGMNVNVSLTTSDTGEPTKSITVSAEGEQAEMLAQLLNLAGLQSGEAGEDCGCEQMEEAYGDTTPTENKPDYPTDEEVTGEDDELLRRWAGGLNKPKSTGQTTAPVVNRDPARGSVGPKEMAENVDLGLNLYAELKSFKAK